MSTQGNTALKVHHHSDSDYNTGVPFALSNGGVLIWAWKLMCNLVVHPIGAHMIKSEHVCIEQIWHTVGVNQRLCDSVENLCDFACSPAGDLCRKEGSPDQKWAALFDKEWWFWLVMAKNVKTDAFRVLSWLFAIQFEWLLNPVGLIHRRWDMAFLGRPPGLPASGSRSPSPKTGSLGRPGDRNFQHCLWLYEFLRTEES